MAKILLTDPLAAISGRTSSSDRIVYRTRNGKTHAYIMRFPSDQPRTDGQKSNSSNFGNIAKQVHEQLNDPTLRQQWQRQFDDYTKRRNPRHKRPIDSNAIPSYSATNKPAITTLYGYIFHTLYEQQKSQSSTSQQ